MDLYHILLIDDHSSIRKPFADNLQKVEPTFNIVDLPNCISVREVISHKFDLILLDFEIPPSDSISNIRLLARLFPSIPIVIFNGVYRVPSVIQYCQKYRLAHSWLEKDSETDEIVFVLKSVLSRKKGSWPMTPPLPVFSDRELQVLMLALEGLEEHKIGKVLRIKRSTVGTHMRSLRRELCVKSRAQIVKEGRDNGYHYLKHAVLTSDMLKRLDDLKE